MGLSPAVVNEFERFFFNVRDRLAAADFILLCVVGYDPFRGFEESNLRGLWQYFGYSAGPKFLELVIAVSQDRPLPEWAVKEASSPVELEALRASTKLSILVETWSLDPRKLRQMQVLHLQLLDLQKKTIANESHSMARVTTLADDFELGDLMVTLTVPSPAAPKADPESIAPADHERAAVA